MLGDHVAKATGIPFAEYLRQAVLEPLGMHRHRLPGSPAARRASPPSTTWSASPPSCRRRGCWPRGRVAEATTVAFPGLQGRAARLRHQNPNDWGLGFEIRDAKSPHWTGAASSPRTFGHFGQSGTFLWVDPDAGRGLRRPDGP